jgi:hypothetical protein
MKYYVYCISDPTGKYPPYYGKGQGKRMYDHWQEFKRLGKHSKNYKLTKMFKHLESKEMNPTYKKIFETCSEEEAYVHEHKIIEEIGLQNLSNIMPGGITGWPTGKKHTYVTKQKMAQAKKGVTLSNEHKQKISEASKKYWIQHPEKRKEMAKLLSGENNGFYGRKHTTETKQKISVAKKGKQLGPRTEEHRRKLSEANKRRYADPSVRRKIGEANTGINNGMYGKKHSLGAREKIRKAGMGRKLSEETKEKIRQAHLKRLKRYKS